MSRRPPNPAAERAAQNQQTIKSLLKLEPNKICADCKRNKHPRWASWNLGVFICIRCSGIHRGMGTHISRVKSVDLDSWTDEQLQSILSWGNARANKYWEAKLAAGHVPSEAKIENFIRTKYELKRWVMDGPMPDPSTLDAEGDDDIPLSIVKEKQNIERKVSIRKASAGQSASPGRQNATPQGDLIGGDPVPPRASSAGPAATKVAPKADPAPPKATSTKDSLLGLDFMGTESAQPPRPASTTGTSASGGQSRPDLKQSILSLYATAPRPQPQSQGPSHAPSGSFGGMQSPISAHQSQGSFGGLNDAFSGLSFSSASSPKSLQASAISSLSNSSAHKPTPQTAADPFSNLSGGSFFDPKPTLTPPSHQAKQSVGGSGGLGSLTAPSAASAPPLKPAITSSSAFGDLFNLSGPARQAAPIPPTNPAPTPAVNSVFNLSSNQPKPLPATTTANPLGSLTSNNWSNADVWGGNAWGTPDTTANEPMKSPDKQPVSNNAAGFGWGPTNSSLASQSIVPGASGGFGTAPKVAADEEFGGWTGGAGGAGGGSGATKPAGGFGTNEDLFSNVWE